MNDTIERLADGTLVFLPERLNRDPAVLRGLTNDEMWVALGVGALVCLILGVPLAIATASIAVAPTSTIAGMAVVLFAGGTLLRAKRARPETLMYRKLEWTLASRWRRSCIPAPGRFEVRQLWPIDRSEAYIGMSGGAGLGYGLGAAIGGALEHQGTGKVCINLQSDGDLLYIPNALWTLSAYDIPPINNRLYLNSKQHAERIAGLPASNRPGHQLP